MTLIIIFSFILYMIYSYNKFLIKDKKKKEIKNKGNLYINENKNNVNQKKQEKSTSTKKSLDLDKELLNILKNKIGELNLEQEEAKSYEEEDIKDDPFKDCNEYFSDYESAEEDINYKELSSKEIEDEVAYFDEKLLSSLSNENIVNSVIVSEIINKAVSLRTEE